MPRFSYSARDRAGKTVTDTLEAPSRKDALRLIAARGLQAAAVNEAGLAPTRATRMVVLPDSRVITLSRKQRLPFLEALRDLVTSGMSAGVAVRLLSVRIKDPGLRLLCAGLWERLSEGAPLSRAMSACPAVFDSS